jgi:cytochrome c
MRYLTVAALMLTIASGEALADGDIAKGEQQFKKCQACHTVSETKNKVGPHLVGTVGRAVGSVEGFNYSVDLKAMNVAGKIWDEVLLDQYLENPKKLAPKGKMSFGGLKKPEDRADLIAYLKSKQ